MAGLASMSLLPVLSGSGPSQVSSIANSKWCLDTGESFYLCLKPCSSIEFYACMQHQEIYHSFSKKAIKEGKLSISFS